MVESLVLIVPEADADAVRLALDEAGYGPNCLTVPMRGKVRVDDPDQATHWGSHWWAGEELDAVMAIVEQAAPGAVVVHSSETMGFELFDAQAGDYIYVPVDPRLIDGLTVGLGELATPQRGLPYAPIVAHPMADKDARLWPLLQLRSEDVVPISLAANSEPLAQVLQAFVDGGGLTLEEMQGLVGAVAAMAGNTIKIADMIPPSWQQYVMTREAAAALGYFGGTPDARVLEQFATGVQSMAERGGA
jgi:hypothetical protein